MSVDAERVRRWSLRQAQVLGYTTNDNLPLLDSTVALKPLAAVTARILCLTAIVTVAWGAPANEAMSWLEQEKLREHLSDKEQLFLRGEGDGDVTGMQLRVEALWALVWAVKGAEKLDFASDCSDDLVRLVPDVTGGEPSTAYRPRWELRSPEQIIQQVDLAYCLHWAIRDALLHRNRPPGKLHPIRVIERRRALEWLVQPAEWDDVTVDT